MQVYTCAIELPVTGVHVNISPALGTKQWKIVFNDYDKRDGTRYWSLSFFKRYILLLCLCHNPFYLNGTFQLFTGHFLNLSHWSKHCFSV